MADYRLKLPEGYEAGAILADPAWPLDQPHKDGNDGLRRRQHYDRMTINEIKSIPVHLIASPDAHLWLWTTNAHLERALEVVHAWGFQYKTMATWVKKRMGLGWWLRSKTEHLILAVKSDRLRHNPGRHTTLLDGEYRGHSRKPDTAYKLVEDLSPGPYLELFATDTSDREGWVKFSSPSVPDDPFGQLHTRRLKIPDKNDGIVRGVDGLVPEPGMWVDWMQKVIRPTLVQVLSQKGRKVQIEIPDMTDKPPKKWVSIDSLRRRD
jgi:N6-adenosine-specific RNA methylase IME4